MKKTIVFLFACIVLSIPVLAQSTMPAVGAYKFNGTIWAPLTSSVSTGAINYIPPAQALYCWNSGISKWVPADSSCLGGGGGGSMVYPAAGIAKSNGTAWVTPAFSDIAQLWASGACSGLLKSDGSCVLTTAFDAAGAAAAAAAASIPLTQKGAANGVAALDSTGVVPLAQARVSSVNSKTGAVVLSPFDIGATPGPDAATTLYYQLLWPLSQYDSTQGFVTYYVPTPSTNFQLVFGNTAGVSEANCGPTYTLDAAIEYPVDSTPLRITFGGQQYVTVPPCGVVTSDPIAIDAQGLLQARFKAYRTNATDTAGFPTNWNYNALTPVATAFAPATTTKGSWDAWEYFQTRTVTDGVTNGTTTLTSATAAFAASDKGQTVTIPGSGAAGSTLTTTIATVTNATTVVLSNAASDSASGKTVNLSMTDKTLSGSIAVSGPFTGFAPVALLGTPTGTVKTAAIICDSRCSGFEASSYYGSWFDQSMDQPGVAAGLATSVHTMIPHINMSQSGELEQNLVNSIKARFRKSKLGLAKYTMVNIGINDISTVHPPATTIEGYDLVFAQELSMRGTKPYFGTIEPQTVSTDNWMTVAGQTPSFVDATRTALNDWRRDGAPVECSALEAYRAGTSSTITPAATGTSSPTAARTQYLSTTGTVVTPASGPCVHPMSATYEFADVFESSRNSGVWKASAAPTTVTGCSITAGTKNLTCTGATFTAANVGYAVAITGAGSGGAYMPSAIFSYTDSTHVTLASNASTTVSGVNMLLDDGPSGYQGPGGGYNNWYTSGRWTIDGTHESGRGHHQGGIVGAAIEGTWVW